MPCFDKKLEASRSDFYMDKAETREVDCVITSGTVAYLYFEVCERKCLAYSHLYLSLYRCLQERFRECLRRRTCLWATWNQRHLMHCELCSSLFSLAVVIKVNWNKFMTSFVCTCWSRFSSVCGDEFLSHSGSGSGGYLHHVFNYAAKHLFGEDVKELTYKILKWVCVACLQKLDWKWALSSSGSSSVEKMVVLLFLSKIFRQIISASGIKTSRKWLLRRTVRSCCASRPHTAFATFRTWCKSSRGESRLITLWKSWPAHQVKWNIRPKLVFSVLWVSKYSIKGKL